MQGCMTSLTSKDNIRASICQHSRVCGHLRVPDVVGELRMGQVIYLELWICHVAPGSSAECSFWLCRAVLGCAEIYHNLIRIGESPSRCHCLSTLVYDCAPMSPIHEIANRNRFLKRLVDLRVCHSPPASPYPRHPQDARVNFHNRLGWGNRYERRPERQG
jgi:hypothetical protein